MQPVRLIPRLDVDGANLIRIERAGMRRILGPADAFACHYAQAGASALWLVDWQMRGWGRSLLRERLARVREAGVPLIVSGAVRSLDEIDTLLAAGATVVGLGVEAIELPELLPGALERFGAAGLAVAIDVRRHPDGRYELASGGNARLDGIGAVEWVRRAAELGCRELHVTSVDRDGTGAGYDLELAAAMRGAAPEMVLTLCGGAGSAEHLCELIAAEVVDGAGLASLLHFEAAPKVLHRSDWSSRAALQYLRESGALDPFELAGLPELRQKLARVGVASGSS